ncbi:MAG: F0F1 ATP synthase subunit epsilon, partial [Bacteroidales bacterium]|nr:F0F1 ATP synthase subunit epsilon [Bacteroidales bacterium]
MKVDVITPEQQLTLDNVSLVQLPGVDGLFEILKGHAPLIAALGKGRAKMEVDGETKSYTVQHGVVEVLKDHVK